MNKDEKKYLLKQFSHDVFILASRDKEKFCASTVTWVSQASFDPPLLSVCIKRKSQSFHIIQNRGAFILHCLDQKQKDIAADFFRPTVKEKDCLNNHTFKFSTSNLPILTEPPAYFECKVVGMLDKGDHPIFLAEITNVNIDREFKIMNLNSTEWSYGG
ncbi:MAG: flavin reductase family protein [Fidelibacterota bacterium]